MTTKLHHNTCLFAGPAVPPPPPKYFLNNINESVTTNYIYDVMEMDENGVKVTVFFDMNMKK